MDYSEYEESNPLENGYDSEVSIDMIVTVFPESSTIALGQADAELTKIWDKINDIHHITDVRLLLTRPAAGKAHKLGQHCLKKLLL